MYICTCHGVRARQIDAAVASGARTAKQALEMCGHSPQCARCCKDIADRIRSKRRGAALAIGVAAE